jgi:uncharacterized membrane protein (Fun14 family)
VAASLANVDVLLNALTPYLGQVSFGGLAGFATGYALKKVGKIALFVFGLLFITLQTLAYFGIIEINWLRIQKAADPLLSQDNLQNLWNGLLAVLTLNLPFAGAFVPGLMLGLRFG